MFDKLVVQVNGYKVLMWILVMKNRSLIDII